MNKKKITIIGICVAVLVLIGGGGIYWNMSHSVAKKVPGNTYVYHNSDNHKKSLYVTFAESGNQVVVSPTKKVALAAGKDEAAFEAAYKKQSKTADWNYKADGNKLTLAQENSNDEISQWQYEGILASNKKFTAHSFTYQIAKAGQGHVKKKIVFDKLN